MGFTFINNNELNLRGYQLMNSSIGTKTLSKKLDEHFRTIKFISRIVVIFF